MSTVYRLKDDDPRMGLHRGDLLLCIGYHLDPEKVTVICRLSDGFKPECNQYKSDIERVSNAELAGFMWRNP